MMDYTTYKVIGVMSGTSRDGIDMAYLEFQHKNQKWEYRFLEVGTFPYPSHWEEILGEADQFDAKKIEQLNRDYTAYLARQINAFIAQHHIRQIDAICSHGHTIFHQPERKYTLQIGNLPELAKRLNQKVVCDFRTQDVLLGGQGAPLVPIGDRLLFSKYDCCLNLGGFANISTETNLHRTAYDICAVNTVLNRYAQQLGHPYDDKGQLARQGKINPDLLKRLKALPFYRQNPPKSLGIEWVKTEVLPLIASFSIPQTDVLATYTHHIAQELASCLPHSPKAKVLTTGGGAYNTFLIEQMQKATPCQIVLPDPRLIDYKEALIFGLLGVLRLRNEPNVLHSVTGAPTDHSAGFIYAPPSF